MKWKKHWFYWALACLSLLCLAVVFSGRQPDRQNLHLLISPVEKHRGQQARHPLPVSWLAAPTDYHNSSRQRQEESKQQLLRKSLRKGLKLTRDYSKSTRSAIVSSNTYENPGGRWLTRLGIVCIVLAGAICVLLLQRYCLNRTRTVNNTHDIVIRQCRENTAYLCSSVASRM